MVQIPLFSEVNALAFIPEGIDPFETIREGLLFAEINEQKYAILSSRDTATALSSYNRLSLDLPLAHLDEQTYETLYLKFLELKTDSELTQSASQEEPYEDELSLIDFLKNSSDLLTSEESAPIIKFVNTIFYQALKRRASDIHIETHEKKGEVRFRIDGVLSKHIDLDKSIISLVISRIKVISNLDIAEKRLPQDGRTQIKIAGKSLDVRVSVLPTYHGERVVMRLLMHAASIPGLEELGFNRSTTERFYELLKFSHGIILVTGPTGSGKSTTLHSFLQRLSGPEKNVMSIEDPVEYDATHVSQIAVNSKIGLTFAEGLRSILRQDPDIILVGEIRDGETAQIAIQAAMTGHLVFSTLHTNNATSAVTRLVDMGVDKFMVTSTLLGVLAQRLVRKVCTECYELHPIDPIDARDLDLPIETIVAKSVGCPSCGGTGYRGRIAVGELLMMDENVQTLMKQCENDVELRTAMKGSMAFLADQLKDLLISHETTLEEILRVGVKEI
ncbi:MAG: type II/IV secretion system protein [Sulfuricurvum sp.]|jgi:general secretion pathway protein E|uniref:GspE/PulE family protein n=1 Tax=Sulfuricurvum sp. TaxID=2025608 RepID=UPI0025E054F7|nr:GspE/PulE family protein [Sulfuricurvum sp.]MCI4406002.1 type II/IV secretion system protein [Sulfuricurvum sp.]